MCDHHLMSDHLPEAITYQKHQNFPVKALNLNLY